jgi:hypothetical protein
MTDERRDEEILGRALSRAIETIDVDQTPYERSRIATAPARRSVFGLWQIATAAAAIVLALAIGSWLARPTESQPGVAASPTTPVATPSAATPTSAATASPTVTSAPTTVDHDKIYLARPGLPPIAVSWLMYGGAVISPGERIAARLNGLPAYQQTAPGLTNYLAKNNFGSPGGGAAQVAIAGDLATVDMHLGAPLNASDHTEALGILQQLVYTATEEPGIRRVLFTQNGGQQLSIGDIKVDKALAREDVFGYKSAGAISSDKTLTWAGDDTIPHVVAKLTSVVNDGTTTRLTFLGTSGNAGTPTALPSFSIALESFDDTQPVGGKTAAARNGGKYQLRVEFQWNGGGTSGGVAGTTVVDQTPLRAMIGANPLTLVELDDARPWRAWMPDKTQLVIEIGGDPRSTSDRIAVTAPKPSDLANSGVDLRVIGSARVFEANVSWRVLDPTGKAVANGHFNASLGSSALWGTFDTRIPLPANIRGTLTLELFEASPKDGSAQGVVQIPLTVR